MSGRRSLYEAREMRPLAHRIARGLAAGGLEKEFAKAAQYELQGAHFFEMSGALELVPPVLEAVRRAYGSEEVFRHCTISARAGNLD
jgi:hypothetical protein